ncbi:MAG: hypothetical protein Q7R97_05445 [Candidatus Daviesbacteria bacterium]|nr:hypothetical protein [Candidatus Daviesbacteria bacterium]
MTEDRIGRLDKMIAGTDSPMMKRIYEKAKTLPAIIPTELARQCWDEAWKGYVEDIRSNTSEVQIGGITIFREDNSRNIGDIYMKPYTEK